MEDRKQIKGDLISLCFMCVHSLWWDGWTDKKDAYDAFDGCVELEIVPIQPIIECGCFRFSGFFNEEEGE